MIEVPDQEIEQLYAARYRTETTYAQSPYLRDSLENSSDGANSVRSSLRSGMVARYQRSVLNNSINEKINKFEGGHNRNSRASPQANAGLLQVAIDRATQKDNVNSPKKSSVPGSDVHSPNTHSITSLAITWSTHANQNRLKDNLKQNDEHSVLTRNLSNTSTSNANNSDTRPNVAGKGSTVNSKRRVQSQISKNVSSDKENLPAQNGIQNINLQNAKTNNNSQVSHSPGSQTSKKNNSATSQIQTKEDANISVQRISNIFAQSKQSDIRTKEKTKNPPVSSAIRNLISYQQDDGSNVHNPKLQKEDHVPGMDADVPPPALPPRRPASLLRVVTEQQLIEHAKPLIGPLSPLAKIQRQSSVTPPGRDVGPSPPYFYGDTDKNSLAHSPLSNNIPKSSDLSPKIISGSEQKDLVSSHVIDDKISTPSPRGRLDFINNELNNPAGLLAYVTRDSNSPHIERSVTGLLKNRLVHGSTSLTEYFNSNRCIHSDVAQNDRQHQEHMNPVRVLPSNLDSRDASEMFRNFQRSSVEPSNNPQERLLNNESSLGAGMHNVQPYHADSTSKKGAGLVKSISRTLSRRKAHDHRELLNDSTSLSSQEEFQTSYERSTRHREQFNTRNNNYRTFENESDDIPSRDSSIRSASDLQHNYRNRPSLIRTVSNAIPVENTPDVKESGAPSETVYNLQGKPARSRKRGDRFWTFTTSVVFPPQRKYIHE